MNHLARGTALLLLTIAFGRASTAAEIVNDVTQLNPISVEAVIAPQTMDELIAAVAQHAGPLSIGGGRYSMGGQTATPGGIQIDMRRFNQVVSYWPERKEITVQAGITWRAIQEYIDASDLSVQIMQTYANFTVGGALSVNAHGRYIGMGPLVLSVKSIRLVLASGEVVLASPTEHSELFYGAIGGYGALGVIAEATLSLTDNTHLERKTVVMSLTDYGRYFAESVRNNPDVVFHNADIYPNAYKTVRATSYVRTDKPLTVPDRLIPKNGKYGLNRLAYRMITGWPGGRWARQHIVEPIFYHGDMVEWRNHEASYDVAELEPASRKDSTYVLQEYFVPVEKLDAFAPKMGDILNRHKVNVVNISIRHAKQDPGTLMAWARHEMFAFVLYYRQGTDGKERAAVGPWTRELIDAAISYGGAYYLPYQVLATPEQFHAAYLNADKLFELKRQVDPENKFRNTLLNAYYDPSASAAPPTTPEPISLEAVHAQPGYRRDEAQTFLTLPEWTLVYIPQEYADSLDSQPPSDFPYFGSIAQFWGYYHDAWEATRKDYPFNWGYHAMVAVIGTSDTVEYGIKGAYEHTVGKIFEWTASNEMTAEDKAAAAFAHRYVDFIRVRPWYEFSFLSELKRLWRDTPILGAHPLRKLERRLVLSAEMLVKAPYATLITLGTHAAYGTADNEVLAVVEGIAAEDLAPIVGTGVVAHVEGGRLEITLPRYEAFRDAVSQLAAKGARFVDIAGNDKILLTAVVPANWTSAMPGVRVALSRPLLTDGHSKRVGLVVPVPLLHQVLGAMAIAGLPVEHIYDY